MPTIIGIDTNILIWGLRRKAEPGQESNVPKAEHLIHSILSEKGVSVIIPAIVLAEATHGLPLDMRVAFTVRVQEYFRVAPFDAAAAQEFSRISKVFCRGKGRQALKADAMILATVLAHQVNIFYTEDNDILAKGGQFVEVRNLPTPPPKQLMLVPQSGAV